MNLKEYKDYLVSTRRHFHKYPEVGFDVLNTILYIKDELSKFGFETYQEETGLIGVLRKGKGPIIALRSDVDALEVPDLTNKEYSSIYENRNHACGHDGHMAMLLGVCKYLSKNKDYFNGTLKVIFQAAEEGPLPGGAMKLSKSIHLKDVESFFALHIMTDYPVKKVVCKPGAFMAAVDIINIKIHGKSTHVANPNLGLNPVNVLPELLSQLNNIIKDNKNLLGITLVKCGETHNVISELCTIRGSLRTFDEKFRTNVKKELDSICNEISSKYNIKIELLIEVGYPSVHNDTGLYNGFKKMILNRYPEDIFIEKKEPSFLSEDFSYYQQQSKGIMAYLGSKNEEKNVIFPNHHYQFDIDEDVLETGMEIYLNIIDEFINKA